MYIINTIPHGKFFARYLRTRCFCIRNLTRSLRSLVRFLIRQQLVHKYRTPALSMKYSLCSIYVGILFGLSTLVQVVRPCSMFCGMFFGLSMVICLVRPSSTVYVGTV